MPDATNQGTPGAGGQLSGEAARQAAIKRLQKLSQASYAKQAAGQPPTALQGAPAAPNR